MSYIPSIGLEVHVQLKTRTKMFCGCPTSFGAAPNTHVCPVCLGYPGALPVANGEAIRRTVRAGLMIGSRINRVSTFDRKNYFYPDMPKNYQISQYDRPLCTGGAVAIGPPASSKTIRITRIHLEEDVGKNLHFEGGSGVDFNRAGTPLMEIVTEPDLSSPDEALEFLTALRQILVHAEITAGNLEEGNLRCDVNCSVRPEGTEALGAKIEIKNMNTFRGVHRALAYEIPRQIRELQRGGRVVQETRRWDDAAGVTEPMRTKEEAHDYRYFPEPDLLPVTLAEETLAAWAVGLPERPDRRRARFEEAYGLPAYDAGVLAAEREIADFFEEVTRRCGQPKAASNWIMTEVRRDLSERGVGLARSKLTAEALAGLIRLVETKAINMPAAKTVFGVLCAEGGDPGAVVTARGLAQVSDAGAIEDFCAQVLEAHPSVVADFRGGKTAALQFLVGQVMKRSRGKANPQMARETLLRRIGG